MHVRIISMHLERYERLRSELLDAGFDDVHLWPGVRPTDAAVAEGVKKGWMVQPRVRNGNVGCFLAHMSLLEKVAHGEEPHVLIVEDDARATNEDALGALRAFMRTCPDFHVLRCNVMRPTGKLSRFAIEHDERGPKSTRDDPDAPRDVVELYETYAHLQDHDRPMVWTSAMLVSKAGANALLCAIKKRPMDMSKHVYDRCFVRWNLKPLRQYAFAAKNKYFLHVEDVSDRDPTAPIAARLRGRGQTILMLIVLACCAAVARACVTRRPMLTCSLMSVLYWRSSVRSSTVCTLKYEEYVPRTGDIVYVSFRGRMNPIVNIQFLVNEYHHVALVVEDASGYPFVYDWSGMGRGHTFRDSVSFFDHLRRSRCYCAVRRLRVELDHAQRAKCLDGVRRMCRRSLPTSVFLRRACKFCVSSATDCAHPKSCVEFVEHILVSAGVRVTPGSLLYARERDADQTYEARVNLV